jgi:hypothetical protein
MYVILRLNVTIEVRLGFKYVFFDTRQRGGVTGSAYYRIVEGEKERKKEKHPK